MKHIVALFTVFFITPASSGEWSYSAESDPFVDDADLYVASVRVTGKKGSISIPQIAIRCTPKKKFEVIIRIGEYLGGSQSGHVNILYRFDNFPSLHSWGIAATEGQYFFIPAKRADAFSVAISLSSKLALKADDFKGSQHLQIFDLSDQGGEIVKVRNACGLEPIINIEAVERDLVERQIDFPGNEELAKQACLEELAKKNLKPMWDGASAPSVVPSEEHLMVAGNATNRAKSEFHTYMCFWQDGMLRSFDLL